MKNSIKNSEANTKGNSQSVDNCWLLGKGYLWNLKRRGEQGIFFLLCYKPVTNKNKTRGMNYLNRKVKT